MGYEVENDADRSLLNPETSSFRQVRGGTEIASLMLVLASPATMCRASGVAAVVANKPFRQFVFLRKLRGRLAWKVDKKSSSRLLPALRFTLVHYTRARFACEIIDGRLIARGSILIYAS